MLRVHHQKFRGDFSGAQPKRLLPVAYRRALSLAMRAQNKTSSLSMKREKTSTMDGGKHSHFKWRNRAFTQKIETLASQIQYS